MFRDAADNYDDLRRRGIRNPELFRNLGNAYLLADDLPQAILAYRRGLRLAPNDWGLRANLAYAREQVAYPAGDFGRPPPDFLPPWMPRIGSAPCLALAVLSYLAGCVALTRWRMTRAHRPFVAGMIALGVAVLFVTVGGLLAWTENEEAQHPLVVLADDGVLLRSGNGLSYPARSDAPLNRGVEARRLLDRGDWLKIELGSGERGWVRRDWVLVDEQGS
jgi:hypothetical protein